MGGSNQYLKITPVVSNGEPTGEYNIDFKVGNFTVSAVGSVINGAFEVRNAADNVTYFTVDPSNNGLVVVKSMIAIGNVSSPTDRLTVQEAYGATDVTFVGSGEDCLEIIQEGTASGQFEVKVADGGKTVDDLTVISDKIFRIAIHNGVCVALFYINSVFSVRVSTNLISWIVLSNVGATSSNTRFNYCGGLFFISNEDGTNYCSPDGITWVQGVTVSGVAVTGAIVFGNGLFVLCARIFGQNGCNIYTSVDGKAWELKAADPFSGYALRLCFGAGLFFAYGSTIDIFQSTDTITWDSSLEIAANTMVAADGYVFATASNVVFRFSGSSLWEDVSAVSIGTSAFVHAAYSDGILLLVDTLKRKYISVDDGVTFETRVSLTGTVNQVDSDEGRFYFVEGFVLKYSVARDRQTFRWRETSGVWSSAIKIIGTNQYELTPYGIKITFAGNKILTTGDLWTFEQGAIGGISVRDSAGVEFFAVRGGEAYKRIGASLRKLLTVDEAVPIGSTYWQLPGKPAPGTLFPDTVWTNISSSFPGAFFRAEGGNASAFGAGQQGDLVKAHGHAASQDQHRHTGGTRRIADSADGQYGSLSNVGSIDYPLIRSNGYFLYDLDYTNYATPAITITQNVGAENRPNNFTIRIWERTE